MDVTAIFGWDEEKMIEYMACLPSTSSKHEVAERFRNYESLSAADQQAFKSELNLDLNKYGFSTIYMQAYTSFYMYMDDTCLMQDIDSLTLTRSKFKVFRKLYRYLKKYKDSVILPKSKPKLYILI